MASDVYTGLWIDHSQSTVLGATITLNAQWGANLVSAATILVSIIGASTWAIAAFFLHHAKAKPDLRDEFDAQVQVLLRNSSGPDAATLDMLRLGKTWHRHKPNAWSKALKTAFLPALLWLAFTVAGVFVGQLATNGYDAPPVLLHRQTCGFITSTANNVNGLSHLAINVSTVSLQYSRACYGGQIDSGISCAYYPVPSLPYDIATQQPCPIPDARACFNGSDSSAITLTTGVLNSHTHLGINAAPSNRVTVQRRATCAPVAYDFVDHFITESTASLPSVGNYSVQHYNIGNYYDGSNRSVAFYPYNYAPAIRYTGANVVAYSLQSIYSNAPHTANLADSFLPFSPFDKTAGDLSVFFLAPNAISYTNPVQDALFRTTDTPNPDYPYSPYLPQRFVYLAACSEESQLCNPNNGRCTGFAPILKLFDDFGSNDSSNNVIAPLQINEQQNATMYRLLLSLDGANMASAVNGVPDPLLASSYLNSPTGSQALPNNQWQQEIQGWFSAVLAQMQFIANIYVHIPDDVVEANDIQIVPPDTPALRDQCTQQRATSPPQYQNYNFFALIFILFFALIVPTIALFLRFFHRKFMRSMGYKDDSYQAEGLLHLHRMAMEGAGYRGWKTGTEEIPRTEFAERRLPQVVLYADDEDDHEMLRYPISSLKKQVTEKSIDRLGGAQED